MLQKRHERKTRYSFRFENKAQREHLETRNLGVTKKGSIYRLLMLEAIKSHFLKS